MIYEYDAFIEVPEKLGEDKMSELDCAIANFIEDRFGFPVEFSILGQVDEKSGDCEIEKVVRCENCKHCMIVDYYTSDDEKYVTLYHCKLYDNVLKNNDDYCNYGERREE